MCENGTFSGLCVEDKRCKYGADCKFVNRPGGCKFYHKQRSSKQNEKLCPSKINSKDTNPKKTYLPNDHSDDEDEKEYDEEYYRKLDENMDKLISLAEDALDEYQKKKMLLNTWQSWIFLK